MDCNVWCIKNRTSHSSKTLLCSVRFLMHQTSDQTLVSYIGDIFFTLRLFKGTVSYIVWKVQLVSPSAFGSIFRLALDLDLKCQLATSIVCDDHKPSILLTKELNLPFFNVAFSKECSFSLLVTMKFFRYSLSYSFCFAN